LIAVFVLIAYLLGSIPNSVWIGKYFYNIDVREFGSGNAGATNTFRVLGKKAGIPVLIFDILKGTLAVALSYFPVFAGFRGGKGVATILGIVICILPLACSLSLGVFLFVLLSSRIVSLSSMVAGISFPIFLNLVLGNTNPILTVFSIIVSTLLIITHRKNIQRLLKKEETKVRLFPVKNK